MIICILMSDTNLITTVISSCNEYLLKIIVQMLQPVVSALSQEFMLVAHVD